MKQSFFIGFLASLALAGEKDAGTGYGLPGSGPGLTLEQK